MVCASSVAESDPRMKSELLRSGVDVKLDGRKLRVNEGYPLKTASMVRLFPSL